jgi:benzoyl-CoA reductase/2-hydroxyglutaryl-CoA dehydratase subunit BcrC/BadD/HgdB
MKRILYNSPFIPMEWILAHGMFPSRITPENPDTAILSIPIEGVCPYARAFAGEVLSRKKDVAGAVFATTCDQMRRIFEYVDSENALPVFLMNIPKTWNTPASSLMFKQEMERLGRFLIGLGGNFPNKESLKAIILEYERKRKILCDPALYKKSSERAKAFLHFYETGETPETQNFNSTFAPHKHLALAGSPLTKKHMFIFDLAEQYGGTIILDATSFGERGLPSEADHNLLEADPAETLFQMYFPAIPDAFQRPNDPLYHWFSKKIAERTIRGIVFATYPWCDTWIAQLPQLREYFSLPVLSIDLADTPNMVSRISTRIQSFLEMLL